MQVTFKSLSTFVKQARDLVAFLEISPPPTVDSNHNSLRNVLRVFIISYSRRCHETSSHSSFYLLLKLRLPDGTLLYLPIEFLYRKIKNDTPHGRYYTFPFSVASVISFGSAARLPFFPQSREDILQWSYYAFAKSFKHFNGKSIG